MSAQPTPYAITMTNGVNGVTGAVTLQALEIENMTVPASTSQLAVPLPAGLATAKFVAVTALLIQDLTMQVSTAGGSTVLKVPMGATVLIYGVTALYVNSVAGGTLQAVFG